MILHYLEMTAIGPFAGKETVDFSDFSNSNLFLLEGPTGSGKSTIIDAITFALYGTVANSFASKDRMRSDFATPQTRSEIWLIFETGAGIYSVRRQPSYQRPKLRGEGVTTEHTKVSLRRFPSIANARADDATGETLSTAIAEADQEIAAAIGLSKDQFVQTIVLPQGAFASFLRSSSRERSAVLSKVFRTYRFAAVQELLITQSKEALQKAQTATANRQQAFQQFEQYWRGHELLDAHQSDFPQGTATAPSKESQTRDEIQVHLEIPPEPADAGDTLALTRVAEYIQEVQTKIAHRIAALQQDLTHAKTQENHARQADEDARAKSELIQRSRAHHARLQELLAAQDQHQTRKRQLRLAQKADEISYVMESRETAKADNKTAENTWLRMREQVQSLPNGYANTNPEELPAAATKLLQIISKLQEIQTREVLLKQVTATLQNDRQRLATYERQLDETKKTLTKLPAALTQAKTAQEQAVAAQLALPASIAAAEQAASQLQGVMDLHQARAKQEQLQKKIRAARDNEIAADKYLDQLLQSRLENMAAALAADLLPEQPCPVCGSCVHPAPAGTTPSLSTSSNPRSGSTNQATANSSAPSPQNAHAIKPDENQHSISAIPSAAEIIAAQDNAAAAAKKTADYSLQNTELARQIGAAETASAGLTLLKAKELLTKAEAQQASLQKQADTQEYFANQITKITAEISDLESALVQINTQCTTLKTSISKDESNQDSLLQLIKDACESFPTVQARIDSLHQTHTIINNADTAYKQLQLAQSQWQKSQEKAATALATAGFSDLADWEESTQDSDWQEQAVAKITAYEKDLHHHQEALKSPELADITPDSPLPDLQASATELAVAARNAQDATAKLARANEAKNTLHSATQEYEQCCQEEVSLYEESGPLIRVGEIAAGRHYGEHKVDLETFVLIRRFKAVVDAANTELTRIADGRFTLRHQQKKGGRSLSGLDIDIYDAYTDTSRDPGTLSGGETFFVSLALALALAEVVRASAGGISLDTLFIDEGFGTLDPSMLDQVMNTLTGLTHNGRNVGIVSHVTDLKQRIPERISVRPCPEGGSTLRR